MKYLYIIFFGALILVSCNNRGVEMPDTKVALNAIVEEMLQYETRSIEGTDIHTTTSVAGMKAAVWFSASNGVYPPSNPQSPTFVPYRAELTYDAGSTIVYTQPDRKEDPVSYAVTGDVLYCVGLYPYTGWTTNAENTKVTHAVDGKQDLMFAPQISGQLLAKMPKQTYSHLLPWVRFTIRAVDPESASDWGQITSIQLVNGKGNITIALGTGNITYDRQGGNIEVLDAALNLTVAIQDIGSTLCLPSAEGYDLQITTTKGGVITLKIDKNFEAGKLYLVNLYFNSLNDINAVCSLVPWNEESVIL